MPPPRWRELVKFQHSGETTEFDDQPSDCADQPDRRLIAISERPTFALLDRKFFLFSERDSDFSIRESLVNVVESLHEKMYMHSCKINKKKQ